MAVHGGPGVLRDLSGELKKLKLGYYEVPQLAHRLDRDTSGVLILSRHPHAAQMLAQWFHNHLIKKIYWAVVIGRPNKIIGTIQVPIGYKNSGRHGFRLVTFPHQTKSDGKWRSLKHSETEYKILRSSDNSHLSLMEVRPVTGHRHQIRIHMADVLNTPILGDSKYCRYRHMQPSILRLLRMDKQQVAELKLHLHSKEIVLPVCDKNRYHHNVRISAPLPDHFVDTLANCKLSKYGFSTPM